MVRNLLSCSAFIATLAAPLAAEITHEQELCIVDGICGESERPDPKPLHPSLYEPYETGIAENRAGLQSVRNGLAEARAQAARAANTANIALGQSVLQMDLSRDNYIGGGLALYDGETVGTIGYSRSIGSADLGLMISTDGNETAVGVFGGWGW
ncbi:hypothetical protein [Ruegeria sp. HKCCA4812]|uniref:hypothetical protein n=1 Tax=Ruegeria sp. HKCCA4812 TaxID=2682993 RepID=UPI00148A0315|nr:hypothetical protein [Ruegeria sp. HKCCA4812]